MDTSPAAVEAALSMVNETTAWHLFYPPTFVHPALTNPRYTPLDNGHIILNSSIAAMVIGIVAVLTRLFSRTFLVRSWGLEDWTIVPALLGFVAWMAELIIGIPKSGLGKHTYDCTFSQIKYFYKLQYMITLTSLPTLMIIRASILFFLIRLAGYHHAGSRNAFIFLQVANLVHMPATMFPTVFMCSPKSYKVWDLLSNLTSGCVTSTKVIRISRTVVGLTVVGVAIDLAMLIVPIYMVLKLKMSLQKKITVCGLFGIGLLACAASMIKAVTLAQQTLTQNTTFDLSYTGTPLFTATIYEGLFGIITACAPHLRPVAAKLMPSINTTVSYVRTITSNGKKHSGARDPWTLGSIDQMTERDPETSHITAHSANRTSLGEVGVQMYTIESETALRNLEPWETRRSDIESKRDGEM